MMQQSTARKNDVRQYGNRQNAGGREIDLGLADMTRNPYLAEYKPAARTHRQQSQKTHYRQQPQERHRVSRKQLQRMRRRRQRRKLAVCGIAVFLLCMAGLKLVNLFQAPDVDGSIDPNAAISAFIDDLTLEKVQGISAKAYGKHPAWEENFLTPNEYSRPGDPLQKVNNIFVHYTANQGTSAKQNRSYFEQLKDTHERSASAHFIIGYDGEIIQCVPLDEIAYAVQTRNEDSISIECCYKASDGSFTQETYDSLLQLLKWLTETYGLSEEDILRHYDCGGKKCPLYYTEHEDAWEKLKQDVKNL